MWWRGRRLGVGGSSENLPASAPSTPPPRYTGSPSPSRDGEELPRLLKLILAATLLAFPATAQARQVALGYLPAFKGMEQAAAGADFSYYTHVALAFVNPGPDGSFIAGDRLACAPNGDKTMLKVEAVKALAARVHAAGGKLVLSLGGGTVPQCAGDWAALTAPAKRAKLVAALTKLVDRVGADGVDVDIEWDVLSKIDKAGDYTPFVAALSAALKAKGRLLTCATASGEGGMIPQASIPYFDLVGVMSYDAIGQSWGEPGAEHATVDQARRDVKLWLDRGVPREKLLLGLPFYGYGFGAAKPNYSFRDIRSEYGDAALLTDTIGSRCGGCTYITYNGLPTLKEKARLARAQAGGIMVWEISQDTPDHLLIRSLQEEPDAAQ